MQSWEQQKRVLLFIFLRFFFIAFFYFFSPVGSRPHTPKSDTECELADRDRKSNVVLPAEALQQWNWGELPQKLEADDIVTQIEPGKDIPDKGTILLCLIHNILIRGSYHISNGYGLA